MEVPYLESDATSRQMEAIASRLGQSYITHEVIYNPYDEAVAVYVPEVISSYEAFSLTYNAMGYAPLQLFAEENTEQHEFVQRRLVGAQATRTLPGGMHSGDVYPFGLHSIIDCAVYAATNGTQLGTDLHAYESGGGDAAAHIDFPGSHANPGPDELHGLNIHLTLSGEGEARFGLMREFQSAITLADGIVQARQDGLSPAEINKYLAQGGTPETDLRMPLALREGVAHVGLAMQQASAPVALRPGDVVLFQARQHLAKKLLPTVHKFSTTQEPRWYAVFTPHGAPLAEVNEERIQTLLAILQYKWPRIQARAKEVIDRFSVE